MFSNLSTEGCDVAGISLEFVVALTAAIDNSCVLGYLLRKMLNIWGGGLGAFLCPSAESFFSELVMHHLIH